MIKSAIDISNWNRKEHFDFFSKMSHPFYGINNNIDITKLLEYSRKSELKFSSVLLYKILKVVNETDALKLRIEDNGVYKYEKINCSATVLREDKTFGFSFVKWDMDYKMFADNYFSEIQNVLLSKGLNFTKEAIRIDTVHYSVLPWFSFTSLSHALDTKVKDSVPKISVGKYFNESGTIKIPISIHVNHALVDGYDIGLFYERLEKEFRLIK